MFDDKLSEDESHEWRLCELYDALKYDTREAVIDCLKKLDRLDGEFIKIIVEQLESPTSSFRNRFELVSSRGRPPSLASEPVIMDGILRYYRKCRQNGLSSKQAIFETEKNYGVKRALIMKIVVEAKDAG
jgi:hypothetical protein